MILRCLQRGSSLDMITEIIDLDVDDVRIYTIVDPGISLAQAVNLADPYIF